MSIEQAEIKKDRYRDGFIVGAALALGLIFNHLFFGKTPGVSFPIFAFLCVTALFVTLQVSGRKPTWSEYWLALPLLFLSTMVAFRASEEMAVLNVFASCGLSLILISVAAGRKVRDLGLWDYPRLVIHSFGFIPKSRVTISALRAYGDQNASKKALRQVLLGLLLAIPFLLLFAGLFSSADLAFGKYTEGFLAHFIDGTTIPRTVIIVLVTLFLIGGLSAAAMGKYLPETAGEQKKKEHGSLMISTFLLMINVLFAAFIVFQIKYLFGGEANVERLGFTYAEYARKGFFELLAVTAISFVMLLGLEHGFADKEDRHHRLFKILSVAHVLMIAIILVSAHLRLALYEEAYGFTADRFFAHAFVFLLATVFLALLWKIQTDGREKDLAFHMLLSLVAFCVCLNVLNPDAFVASQNMKRYQVTQKIDASYLGRLSADALPTTLPFLDASDETVRKEFMEALRGRFHYSQLERSEWQSYDVSHSQAVRLLQARSFDFAIPSSDGQ